MSHGEHLPCSAGLGGRAEAPCPAQGLVTLQPATPPHRERVSSGGVPAAPGGAGLPPVLEAPGRNGYQAGCEWAAYGAHRPDGTQGTLFGMRFESLDLPTPVTQSLSFSF